MSFTPGGGAVISFSVEGAPAAVRQVETIGDALDRLAGVATAGIATLAAGFAAMQIADYAKDATLLAARYETLGVVMDNVGKNAGYTASSMASFAAGLQSQGISMVQSRESLTALAQAHVDLSSSMKLARVAQDAAVIGGISSSEAFKRMTVGLQQGDVEILRNLGLNVNFQAAYALTAATLHKHVDLLTDTEKTQARVNELMAVGSDIAGSYQQAMGTAGKQLSSMSRYMEDLKVKVGGVFLDGFTKQVELQTVALKALGVAMDDSLNKSTLTDFASTMGSVTGQITGGIVATITALGRHKEAVEDLVATYAIYRGALLAVPYAGAIAAGAGYIAALVTQGTVTWGATGAAVALARAQVASTSTAAARALSSNAVAIATVEEAAAALATTTSIQGQFIATEALTAAQATLATTTQAVILAQGEAAVAAGALTAAEGAASIGAYALATALGALEAVLAIVASPIFLITAALAAATAAFIHFKNKAGEKVSTDLPSFDDTASQLKKLNEEQKYGTGLLGDNAKQIEAVTSKIKELNLAKDAKSASIGSGQSQYSTQLKAEVASIAGEVKKYQVQLDQLQQIREKLGGADKRIDLGNFEQLNALTSKYTLPPARMADVMATLQPAIDAAKKRVSTQTYAGDDAEQAKARAAKMAGVEEQAKNARLGIQYAFASEINTVNKGMEVAAQNSATRLTAIDARALSDAKAMYDLRISSLAEYVDRENALNAKDAAAAMALADKKVAAARATVGGDPVANAQALSTAIAERDALAQKTAQQATEGRRSAAEAALQSYTKEFGTVQSLADAQDELNRSTHDAYVLAGKSADQQEIYSASRLQSVALSIRADMEERSKNGEATQEYLASASKLAEAYEQMGAARLKALASNVSASFLNDAKTMRDETTTIYSDMRNTFIGTDEERVRSAAQTSIRLAAIRKEDASAAIEKTNDTSAQKLARQFKLMDDYDAYVKEVNANADAKIAQTSVGFRTLADVMNNAFDPTRVEQFGSAMQSALGNAGGAIGGLVDAMNNYTLQQNALAAARTTASQNYANDQKKLAAATQAINLEQTRSTLGYYSNIAGAAKGFFNENSKGYKVLQGVQMAFHAVETALAIEAAVEKIASITAVTAAETAGAGARVATQTAATATSVGLAGTEASAWGVTAVVRAIASMPFPLNIAAGAATLAAVIAVGAKMVGGLGGGSISLSEQRQAAQGTGTVLGDSSAKSDSLKRSIDLTASNSSTQINYLSAMTTSLKSIEASIGNFASELLKDPNIANPDVHLNKNNGFATTALEAYGFGAVGLVVAKLIPAVGNIIGKIATSVFGGKQSVEDSGFTVAKDSLGNISRNGAAGYSYADVKTSGGWFSSDKMNTQYYKLANDANTQFTAIIKSLGDSIAQAGTLLGINGDDFTKKLNGFVVDIGKISLKGLSAEDQQKALQAVFSKLGDQMAQAAIPDLARFQQAGEGYLETLVRVASDYAKLDASLQSIGATFGQTGVASIGARENLIQLLGGIDEFQSKTADYAQNFLTKAQQLAPVQAFVTSQLNSLGLGWIKTREDFARAIDTLSGSLDIPGMQQTYAALMNLEAAFAAVTPAIEDTTKSLQDIADERKDLQDQLDQLTMTSAQLLEKQRNALDASNRSLFDQVQAAQKAKDASDAAKNSLSSFLDQMKGFATTAAGLNNSLLVGSLSTLTPEQQLAEARRQYEQTKQRALANDATAQGQLNSVEQTFLQLSQKLNGGDAAYSSDLADVLRTNDQVAAAASQQVSIAQQQLDALNVIASGVTSWKGAIPTMAPAEVPYDWSVPAGSVPRIAHQAAAVAQGDYSGIGAPNTDALVAEIKSLREEVAGLRADQRQQTADVIGSNERVTSEAAGTVVVGVHDAVTDGAYATSKGTRSLV